ncbi:hypothetical protein BJ546DRAFT_49885 [Cryomyces antarcticus]
MGFPVTRGFVVLRSCAFSARRASVHRGSIPRPHLHPSPPPPPSLSPPFRAPKGARPLPPQPQRQRTAPAHVQRPQRPYQRRPSARQRSCSSRSQARSRSRRRWRWRRRRRRWSSGSSRPGGRRRWRKRSGRRTGGGGGGCQGRVRESEEGRNREIAPPPCSHLPGRREREGRAGGKRKPAGLQTYNGRTRSKRRPPTGPNPLARISSKRVPAPGRVREGGVGGDEAGEQKQGGEGEHGCGVGRYAEGRGGRAGLETSGRMLVGGKREAEGVCRRRGVLSLVNGRGVRAWVGAGMEEKRRCCWTAGRGRQSEQRPFREPKTSHKPKHPAAMSE